MSNNDQPDLGRDIIIYHKIITRGIEISNKNAQEYLNKEHLEVSSETGFLKYLQTLSSILKAHHMAEDNVIFPYVQNLIPEVPYKRLMDEHEILSAELQKIENTIPDLKSNNDLKISLRQLNSALAKIDELWHPHIKIEEHMIYEKIGSMINTPDMIQLKTEFTQFYQKNVSPDYLVVPFSLYNLHPNERALISKGIPEIVIKQMVPIDWKDKWAPMKPFLLK
jgi:hemerythrin-like domain-containing protein